MTKKWIPALLILTMFGSGLPLTAHASDAPVAVVDDAPAPVGMDDPVAVDENAPVAVNESAPVTVRGPIVQTDHQLYSYEEMMEDLALLAETYPHVLRVESIGLSTEGRQIPVVFFGNRNAQKHIMIQSTMHAREYMATLLTMALIDRYAMNYDTGSVEGVPYSTLFQNVCLVILPMVNPDGVAIAQYGIAAARTEYARSWLYQAMQKKPLDQIKSNANGVDINKNLPVGFTKLGYAKLYAPAPEGLGGPAAGSEKETQALMKAASLYTYSAFVNYHTLGNIIYYGSSAATDSVNVSCSALARLLNMYNGYKLKASYDSNPAGTFADYVTSKYGKPSATVELGSGSHPVPIAQFSDIYRRNAGSWEGLVYAVYAGWL